MIAAERNFHPTVAEETFKRFLRCPPRFPFDGPLGENARWARQWFAAHGRPWFGALELEAEVRPDHGLRVDGIDMGTPTLAARFSGVASVVLAAVSAGPEAEAEATARWQADEPDRYFFIDSYASAVVSELLREVTRRIEVWAGARTVLPLHCPGFRGWPVTDTVPLVDLLRRRAALPGRLEALSSGMLSPKKSQLALLGLRPGEPAGKGGR